MKPAIAFGAEQSMSGYEKLAAFAAAVTLFVWLAPKVMAVVLGSAASIVSPRERVPGRVVRDEPAATLSGFAAGAVEAAGGSWTDAAEINDALEHLRALRRTQVSRDDTSLRSSLAWKIAVCSQAALYRLVAASDSAVAAWNERNPAGAMIATKAAVEYAASLANYATRIAQLAATQETAEIEAFVDAHGFGDVFRAETRAPGASPGLPDGPGLPAAVRTAYARLSALAGDDAVLRYQLYGRLDKTGTSVSFSPEESCDKSIFDLVVAGLRVILTVDDTLAAIDLTVDRLGEESASF